MALVSSLSPRGRLRLDLDANALHDMLDSAALTDDELTAGPATWARYPDPFPAHEPADDAAP